MEAEHRRVTEARAQTVRLWPLELTVDAERARTAATAIVLAVLTFLLYWYLGPQETVYGFQVSQANNIIHGHLDMTDQYTKNIGVLERVLYDGEGFCFPEGNPRGVDEVENPRITPECKTYMQHSLGPAFMEVPGVLLFGVDMNQTLVSVVIAAMTAPVVYLITRKFSDSLLTQVSLTILVMFGTMLWWVGSNGGVWFFAHTTSVFFLFCMIYSTVVLRNPLLAGAFAGAAFMSRPTLLMSGLFPLVAFSDQWLASAQPGQPAWKRIRPESLANMLAGVLPFIALTMLVNYLRFDTPFESGYQYGEQVHQTALQGIYNHGILDVSYIERHIPVFWEQMPLFQKNGPYVLPSWFGLAMWVTTPALFLAMFVHIKQDRRLALWGAAAIALACLIVLTRALSRDLGWFGDWGREEIPLGVHLLPFWLMIGVAIGAAVLSRDRLVLACWAAIIPITFANWLFAATGWSQFGYRYGLDFMPFLWLLVVLSVGRQAKWYHFGLIALSVLVNLWGVLWIYQFEPHRTNGWNWVRF